MDTINEITATYQRIAEEGRSELNKVQNKYYRIGSLRLLLFVEGIGARSWRHTLHIEDREALQESDFTDGGC